MGIRHTHLGAGRPVKHPGRNLQPTVRIGTAQAAAKNSATRPLDRRVTACLTWIQATSTGGLRPCLRSVAGCATPTGFAGHAGATTSLKLTFDPDHSVGANHVIGLAGVLMTALGLMSGAIPSSIPILIDRQLARVRPFTNVVVGDSLAALCPWKWSFGLSPVAVVNLAVSGSDIRGMTHQIDLADQFRAIRSLSQA